MLSDKRPAALYVLDRSLSPPSFLPADVDRRELLDITRIGDAYRRYLHPLTGREHVGADYCAEAARTTVIDASCIKDDRP